MSTSAVGLSTGVVRPIIEPLWTPKQVAVYLGVSVDWVYDHISRREPKLPAVLLGTRRKGERPLIRFRREDIERFVEQYRQTLTTRIM
jgi:excisionase family DNA binding protein